MKLALAALALLTLTAFQDEPRRPGAGAGMDAMRQMMAPPSSMVVAADHIFILSGSKLLKIDPKEMKIVAELEIPRQAPAAGGPGGGDRPARRPAGGGDAPPPKDN